MRLEFTLTGVSPILMHNGAAGIDARSPLSREIAEIVAKKGGDRTDVDDLRLQELECQRSLYLSADGKPTLPEAALRAMSCGLPHRHRSKASKNISAPA